MMMSFYVDTSRLGLPNHMIFTDLSCALLLEELESRMRTPSPVLIPAREQDLLFFLHVALLVL